MQQFAFPAYLINVDRHEERRAASINELKTVGFDYIRLSAVDYHDLDAGTIDSVVDDTPNTPFKRNISPGEIACFLSHIKVWEEIAAGSAEMAWVFEDDVSFCENAGDTILEIESRDRDWDMLRLYSHKPIRLERADDLNGRYAIGFSRKYPMSTIAYAITRPAARFLARSMQPFNLPIDMALKLWWEHGLCTRVVAPSICQPRSDAHSASTLDAQRQSSKRKGLGERLLHNARFHFHVAKMRRIHADDFPFSSRFS